MSHNLIQLIQNFFKTKRPIYSLLFPIILLRRKIRIRKAEKYNRLYTSMFEMVENESLIVKVPLFLGSFEINLRSHVLKRILLEKSYEATSIKIVNTYLDPKKDVLDIGANIGLYTVLCSKKISKNNKVLSVEPSHSATKYLIQNVRRNTVAEAVILFEGVVTNLQGLVQLNVIPGMEEYSSLRRITHLAVYEKISKQVKVKSETIDNLVKQHNLRPGFIKIDTEGAEWLVLQGAIDTVVNHKPIILCELADSLLANFGHTSQMAINFLKENGYEIVDIKNPRFPISTSFEGEILAVPKENKGFHIKQYLL